jgi:TolB protein
MYFIQLSRQRRGRVVAAMVVAATISACVADEPTVPSANAPTGASAQLGTPKPNCWPKCSTVGRILYTKFDTTLKVGRIWVMNGDTTGRTQLTFGNGNDDYPAWSPDYQKVAFMSKRRGAWEIFVMNADGSGQTPITTAKPGESDQYPSWSPDGSKIYFSHVTPDAAPLYWHSALYSVKPNGAAYTAVADLAGVSLWDPAVSPDGKKILVTRLTTGSWGDAHLFTINPDGTGLTQLANTDLGEGQGTWSPDGTKIAFIVNNGYSKSRELATMNANGSGMKIVFPLTGEQDDPSWSPDGSRIVFTDFAVNPWGWLYSVKSDGTGLTLLQNGLDLGSYSSPAWSR